MTKSNPLRHLGWILAATMLVSGCSSIADKVGEKVIEKGVEAAGGGDADINFDEEGGKISIESSEGSFEIGGGEVPEDFPDTLPLPENLEVVSSMALGSDAERTFNLTFAGEGGDVKAIAEDLQSRVEGAGFTINGTNSMDADDYMMRSLTFSGLDWEGNVTVSNSDDGAMVNYTVMTASDD